MPRRNHELLGVALALLAGAAAARAEDPPAPAWRAASAAERDAFLAAWGEKFQAVKSLEIAFRQEKRLKILRAPRQSQGELAYQDGKLRVTVRGKEGEVESELLMQGGELQVHYPRLKRLEVVEVGRGPPGAGAGPAIPLFAADPKELGKTYEVTLERGAASDRLTLVPRAAGSPVKLIEMVLMNHEVREYRQVDAKGDEVRMQMLTAKLNGEIPAKRFELEIPAGTRVVRLGGEARDGGQEPRR